MEQMSFSMEWKIKGLTDDKSIKCFKQIVFINVLLMLNMQVDLKDGTHCVMILVNL